MDEFDMMQEEILWPTVIDDSEYYADANGNRWQDESEAEAEAEAEAENFLITSQTTRA